MKKRHFIKLECNNADVPGLVDGYGCGIFCHSLGSLLDVGGYGNGLIGMFADDYGAINVYKDTDGRYRGMLMRRWQTISTFIGDRYERDRLEEWLTAAMACCSENEQIPPSVEAITKEPSQ